MTAAGTFSNHPHRTLIGLAIPVLGSLVAEPLTGLVDTAFVARLGSVSLAALGVGTVLLSSLFWTFNFLGIGTQTEVARASGARDSEAGQRAWSAAFWLSVALGIVLPVTSPLWLEPAARLMGADGSLLDPTLHYVRIRLFGAPATLAMVAAFGALRGRQQMRLPLWIAIGTNLSNVALDALLIFGLGPIPALGITGAAWASTASHWLGGSLAVAAASARIGRPGPVDPRRALALLVVGRDLFLRTGLLVTFIALTTRTATLAGPESGAAHQAVRQVWILTALALDAFAVSAQSLVGHFLGAGDRGAARRVAAVAVWWGVGSGFVIGLLMLAAESLTAALLVPPAATAIFGGAWLAAALFQPLNAISFVTDGIHWGTGDYRYLRNAVMTATLVGGIGLATVDTASTSALTSIWVVTGGWVAIRAVLGVLRIWPGIGRAPLRAPHPRARAAE